jgi:hypothetical protein
MNMSIMLLLDLINKSREDYATEDINILYLFRKAVEVIDRNENLPPRIHDELYKARLRVKEGDNYGEMLQVLTSVCYMCLQQPRQRQPQTKVIQNNPTVEQLTAQVKALTFQGKEKKSGNQQAQQAQQKNNAVSQPQDGGKNKTFKTGDKRRKSFKRKYTFVEPWPVGVPYLSKSGNTLKPEVDAHFKNFCLKCGCDNHKADSCITYPEKTTIITICSRCRQGFHEECRSKRRGLQGKPKDPQVMAVQTYQVLANLQENFLQQQQLLQQIQQQQQNKSTKKKSSGAITVVTPDGDSD